MPLEAHFYAKKKAKKMKDLGLPPSRIPACRRLVFRNPLESCYNLRDPRTSVGIMFNTVPICVLVLQNAMNQ